MKICVLTLGCKVNSYESEYTIEKFKEAGYTQVPLDENPDVVVVNTCSVTNQSDAKSRHMIRLARKTAPNAILVACGCSCQNHQDKLSELDIDILIGNKDKSKILDLVNEYRNTKNKITKFYDLSRDMPFEDMVLNSRENHTRAFVKIQDGCENFCSYCIIPYMRGKKRSKDFDKAINEIKTLVNLGHKEIVLTGIHTGSYGEGTDHDLVDLIHEISKIEDLKRIRISSIEITELTDKFMKELETNPKICDHMHIPLQSGSDVVLKMMNRKYDLNYYRNIINKLRTIRPDISITTDLIVGFPYETDKEFEHTLNFLDEMHFTKIHTFPFSLRSNTKAEEMKEHFVDEKIKKERVKKVIELSNKMENEYYNKFLNKTMDIIVETSSNGISRGHTSNYIQINTNASLEEGSIVNIKLTTIDGLIVNGEEQNID